MMTKGYFDTAAFQQTLLFTCLLISSFASLAAQLTVSLDNPPKSGIVELQIYDSVSTFVSEQNPLKAVRYNLAEPEPYIIDGLPSGEYALRIYHDENNNKRVDKNFIGIPTELIGFSNRYMPKAPPSFSRAAFVLREGETRHFDIELYLPLGERGQLGVGLGLITRTSPYKDYQGGVSQYIPAITYVGERLQVFGPQLQWSLADTDNLRLALVGQYRIGVYEEKDSAFLVGLGDRENTFLAGLALKAQLPAAVDLEISYKHDLLDRVGGGMANLNISKDLQRGILRITPQLQFNYLSADLSNYDFGVPAEKATMLRPAYKLSSTSSIEVGIGLFAEITREWLLLVDLRYEALNDDVVNSPLVDEGSVIKGFAVINYVF